MKISFVLMNSQDEGEARSMLNLLNARSFNLDCASRWESGFRQSVTCTFHANFLKQERVFLIEEKPSTMALHQACQAYSLVESDAINARNVDRRHGKKEMKRQRRRLRRRWRGSVRQICRH